MEVIDLNINKITPYDKNAKEHPDEQVQLISNSIKEFGFKTPIVVDENFVIIQGHGRRLASLSLGLETVPCVIADELSKEQVKMLRLADNRVAESEWDVPLLDMELLDLNEFFKLEDFGFEFEEPNDLNEDEADTVPEIEENPVIKRGDIIELGNHRLLCGDSTSEDDVAKLIDGVKIDLVYTDPPYGINEEGDRSERGGLGKGGLAKACEYKNFKDDSIEYAVKALDIVESLNIPRQIWWGANYYTHHIPQTNNWIIWDKRVEEKQHDTQSDCEMAYVKSKWSSVRIFRHLWKGMMKDSERGQARVHPTQKPVALAEWCFNYYKTDFKNVLDLFGGSGSTMIACENVGKSCFMMDFEPHYAQVIIQRWCDYTSIDSIKINGEEVLWSEYKDNALAEMPSNS